MKKMLGKRFMFLVALLVGLCMPTMARTTVSKTIANSDFPVTGTVDDGGVISYSAADGRVKSGNENAYCLEVVKNENLVFESIENAYIENIELTVDYVWYVIGTTYYTGGVKSNSIAATRRDGKTVAAPSVSTNGATISISFSPDNAPDNVVIKPSSEMRVVTMKVSYSKVPVDVEGYYFIRNVATGLHLKYGATWGHTAAEGNAAHPFVLKELSGGKYAISSIGGYLNHNDLNMVSAEGDSRWSLVPVSGSTNRYHLLTPTMRMLASNGVEGGQVALVPYDATTGNNADKRLQWELVTPEQLRVEKSAAELAGSPVDMTPLIRAASFDLYDALENDDYPLGGMTAYREYWKYLGEDASYSTLESGDLWDFSWHQVNRDGTPDGYSMSNVFRNNVRRKFTFSQNLGKLPAGTYTFSFEGFVRGMRTSGNSYVDHNPTVTVDVVGANETTLTQKTCTLAVNKDLAANETTYKFIAESGYQLNGDREKDDVNRYAAKYAAQQFKEHDNYKQTITFTLSQATDNVQILVDKSSDELDWTNVQLLIAFDNFSLFYHGNGNGATSPAHGNMYYDKIVAALNSAKAKLDALPHKVTIDGKEVDIPGCPNTHNAAWTSGITSIDITTKVQSKIALLNGVDVDSEEEYVAVLSIIEAAYQAALEAHRQAINSLLNDDDEWIDPYIVNPSFELGNLTGWEVQNKLSDVDVFKNEGLKATNGTDGSYLFNAFINNTDTNTPWVKQTVKGLKNGLYKLTAKLTSAAGNKVYLLADSYHSSITAADPNTFQPAELYFLVENGTATGGGTVTIGAIGGNNRARDGEPYEFYYPWGGCWFKADDFHLEYVCQPNLGRLKLVLNEADEAYEAFDADGKASFKATKDAKESIYNNAKTSKTDLGSSVVDEHITDIYSKLVIAAKLQMSEGADMTYAIINPNFEWGAILGLSETYPGWNCSTGNDTKTAMQENGTYTVVGADGRYLFNTWNNNTAQPLTQTIGGLPNGSYKVSAVLATDGGQSVTLTAGGKSITKKSQIAKNNGELIEYDDEAYAETYCEVTDGNLTIEVKGENSVWFKADNFRLTLVKPAVLDLYDDKGTEQFELTRFYEPFIWINVHRTIKAGSWSTLVLPFNMPIIPAGWEVKKLSTKNQPVHNDGNITLRFDAVESIEAGVPYMVRVSEQCNAIMASQASLNTLLTEPSYSTYCGSYKVTFVGSYAPDYLPETVEGKEEIFFVSGNKFYRSTGTGNYMKAFRAYFKIEPTSPDAPALRSLSMRIGDETIIESVEDEETVVGIYNVNGVKLESMQPGINILRMNNGTTKKVIVK